MTEWKQNLYRNKEDLKIHSSLLSKQQKTWRKRKGKYMRLLIIQQCLVSNISSFMIECRLEVDKVATPFDVFHQSTCSWRLPRWSVHQPGNLNLHEDLESESELWSLDTTKEDCMQWAESSHHHIWYICNKWKFVVTQIVSFSSQKAPFPYHIHSNWPLILGEKNKRQGKAYSNIFCNMCVENVGHSSILLGTAQCKMWLYSICHACHKFQNDDFKQKN